MIEDSESSSSSWLRRALSKFRRGKNKKSHYKHPTAVPSEMEYVRDIVTNLMEADVSDIMIHRNEAAFINLSATRQEVQGIIHGFCKTPDKFYRAIPICDNSLDNVCGYTDIHDLIEFYMSGQKHFEEKKYLKKVLFVAPSMRAVDLYIRMHNASQYVAIVLDEYGGTEGIVYVDNIMLLITGSAADSITFSGGKCEVSGRIDLEVLESKLGVRLTLDDMPNDLETLGGLIMHILGRVPATGELVHHDSGVTFGIVEASSKAILRVLVDSTDIKKRD